VILTMFGELREGRIGRLRYLGYSIFVALSAFLFSVGLGLVTGVTERVAGIEGAPMRSAVTENFAGMWILLFFAIGMTIFFINANLMAKRARDIGLSGWTTVAVILVISMIISLVMPEYVAGGYNLLVWIALLLIPTGARAEKRELL
jgi:uncharacterized membrane protein YhaH (DUF805 family)